MVAENLGCWADTSNRAVQPLEGLVSVLDGPYESRREALEKCIQAGYLRGYNVIALQNGGWCAGARDALYTYKKYGASNKCEADGKGGPWANQVYRLQIKMEE